jgi:hypothetical protein
VFPGKITSAENRPVLSLEEDIGLKLGAIRNEVAATADVLSTNNVTVVDNQLQFAMFTTDVNLKTNDIPRSDQPNGNPIAKAYGDNFSWPYQPSEPSYPSAYPYAVFHSGDASLKTTTSGDTTSGVAVSETLAPSLFDHGQPSQQLNEPTSSQQATCNSWEVAAPQPAHYASAPSLPQPKPAKYERVFLHDLPPTLPAPPTVGSASTQQYPSQEEVIGPRRKQERKEIDEQAAIKNWYRQFDKTWRASHVSTPNASSVESLQFEKKEKDVVSKDGQNVPLKPKSIPFASPYIQMKDTAKTAEEDLAAAKFNPSVPPPSVD